MPLKLLVISLAAAGCLGAQIPSSVKTCKRKDADFSGCLLAAVQDAFAKSPIKEIGLKAIDPLEIPSLKIGAGSGAVAFQQNYKNMKVSGMSKLTCASVVLKAEAKTFTMDCSAPLARMDFQYEVSGKILLLPIFGKGPGFIDLVRLNLKQVFHLEEYEKKGQKHYKVVSSKLDLAPESIKFRLDNLFDGDKALGDNINQVLNDNWSEVFADVKPSYEDAFGQIFTSLFNEVLSKVPISRLFGDA